MAITTGKVRASYVSIFQPKVPQNGGDPKYSVTLLIPKTDTATINGIYAEMEKAKQEGAQKVFGGNVPPVCRTPLYDGDGVRPSGEAFGEECRGHLVMTASAVQKIEDGEPLTARVSAEEAFGGSNAYNAVPAMPYPGAVPAGIPYPQVSPGGYQQPVSTAYPAQPAPAPMAFQQQPIPALTGYPQQAGQIDPITGRPMLTGGVMGLS